MHSGLLVSTFQERFNILFNDSGKTIKELAKDLHVSFQTISAWKIGTRSPKEPTVIAIADYFGVSVPWLLGFDVEKEDTRTKRTITLPNASAFSRMLNYMSLEDYDTLWHIFDRANKKMQEKGIKP